MAGSETRYPLASALAQTASRVDAGTHEIVAAELTPDDVGDVSELPGLLDLIDTEIASLTADGAYDGEIAYNAVANRHPDAEVIIPPRARLSSKRNYDDAA